MNSIAFDHIVRQKFFGANFIKSILLQIAVPSLSSTLERSQFILPRALELTYNPNKLQGFAKDYGYPGSPFIWDEERRFLSRCELDAMFFRFTELKSLILNTSLIHSEYCKIKTMIDTGNIVPNALFLRSTMRCSRPCRQASPTRPTLTRHRQTRA